MATCRTCGAPFDWGFDSATERWVPLEPVSTHDDLHRSFVTASGELRADHRDRHNAGLPTLVVSRLAEPVAPLEANNRSDASAQASPRRRRKRSA